MEPDESSNVVANSAAEEDALPIGHPVKHDAVEGGFARLFLTESLLAPVQADM
jgi:hypothetical protein